MNIYAKYKSPLGYELDNNGIDSYGVDHNHFSTRDELEYQMARTDREAQLMKNYNNQGITGNYPQYGTNFWGGAENNYGFGSSGISQNVQDVTKRLNNSGIVALQTPQMQQQAVSIPQPQTSQWMQNQNKTPFGHPVLTPLISDNSYTTESVWGYPNNTQSPYYQQMGKPYNMNQSSLSGMANIQRNINTIQPTNYSLYGDGFSKEFIDRMEGDEEFQKILNEYIIPNEGGYNNDPYDTGGETNMGIAKTAHSDEDIKNMTRERANAIIYRDYYSWNGLNKLPYPIRGFVVDYGLPTRPQLAVETVHKVLDIPPPSNIIGPVTLQKFEHYNEDDYNRFLERYRNEMKNHFNEVVKKRPEKHKFLQGWLNRADGAHLAK